MWCSLPVSHWSKLNEIFAKISELYSVYSKNNNFLKSALKKCSVSVSSSSWCYPHNNSTLRMDWRVRPTLSMLLPPFQITFFSPLSVLSKSFPTSPCPNPVCVSEESRNAFLRRAFLLTLPLPHRNPEVPNPVSVENAWAVWEEEGETGRDFRGSKTGFPLPVICLREVLAQTSRSAGDHCWIVRTSSEGAGQPHGDEEMHDQEPPF